MNIKLVNAALGVSISIVLVVGCSDRIDPHVQLQKKQWLEIEVADALNKRNEAWNRGDVSGYMAGYANSNFTTYSFRGETLCGWKLISDRIAVESQSLNGLGRLSIVDPDIHILGSPWQNSPVACVFGRWCVARNSGAMAGDFTMIIRKLQEGWRILHEHRSVDP